MMMMMMMMTTNRVASRCMQGMPGYEITLDSYALKSPAKRPFVVPTRQLALGIAEEWRRQEKRVDPNTMPLMSLAATAIDQPQHKNVVVENILSFLSTDPVLCRVEDDGKKLHDTQKRLLNPILEWINEELQMGLKTTDSIFGAKIAPEQHDKMRQFLQGAEAGLLNYVEAFIAFVIVEPLLSSSMWIMVFTVWISCCVQISTAGK